MRFWDASAVVPLVVTEPGSRHVERWAKEDPGIVAWWGTEVECAAAIARLERDGLLDESAVEAALAGLAQLARGWIEIEPSDVVRETATRLLRVHALRAGDALQLAAAHVASDRRPASLEFVTLDDRLASAARREGFVVRD